MNFQFSSKFKKKNTHTHTQRLNKIKSILWYCTHWYYALKLISFKLTVHELLWISKFAYILRIQICHKVLAFYMWVADEGYVSFCFIIIYSLLKFMLHILRKLMSKANITSSDWKHEGKTHVWCMCLRMHVYIWFHTIKITRSIIRKDQVKASSQTLSSL